MTLDNSSPSASDPTVYSLNPTESLNRWSAIIICGVVGLVLLSLSSSFGRGRTDPAGQFFVVAAGIVELVIGLYFGYQTALTSLAISAEGVTYRWGTGSVTAAWQQVRSVEHRRGGGRNPSFDALILSNRDGSINLSQFDVNWRDGDLGQQLKQYAPWLFSGARSADGNQSQNV